MFCIECGTQLPDSAAFCHACGAKAVREGVEGAPPTAIAEGESGADTPMTPTTPRVAESSEATASGVPASADTELQMPAESPAALEARSAQGRGEVHWISYHDVYLWPSPHDRNVGDPEILPKGMKVEVMERSGEGKVRVVTEDGSSGWLNAIVLSRRPVERKTPSTRERSLARCTVCGRSLTPAEEMQGRTAHRACLAREAGFVPEEEREAAARRYARREGSLRQEPSPYRQGSGSEVGVVGRILFLLGGIGMVASPFLPWLSVSFIFTVNVSLYDAAKMLDDYSAFAEVLTIGIVAAAGGLLRVTRIINLTIGRVWAVLAGGAGLVEVIYRYTKFQDAFGPAFALASMQFGFYLLAFASLAVLVSVFLDRE